VILHLGTNKLCEVSEGLRAIENLGWDGLASANKIHRGA
jgi:hypothetical protein